MFLLLLPCVMAALVSTETVIQQHSSSAWGSSANGATLDQGSATFQGVSSGQDESQLGLRSSFGSRRGPARPRQYAGSSRPLPDVSQLLGGLQPGQPLFQAPDIHGMVQQALGASLARGSAFGGVTSGQQQTVGGGVSQVTSVQSGAEGDAHNGGSRQGRGSSFDVRQQTVSGQEVRSDTSASSVQSGGSPRSREYPRW